MFGQMKQIYLLIERNYFLVMNSDKIDESEIDMLFKECNRFLKILNSKRLSLSAEEFSKLYNRIITMINSLNNYVSKSNER